MKRKAIRIEMEFPQEFEEVEIVVAIKDQIKKLMQKNGKDGKPIGVTSSIVATAFNRSKRHTLEILTDMENKGILKSKFEDVRYNNTIHRSRVFRLK
tara:strand:+ start:7228 stop:7518 length:291 start_codon:yes stop_codon:yes gene_type:complete